MMENYYNKPYLIGAYDPYQVLFRLEGSMFRSFLGVGRGRVGVVQGCMGAVHGRVGVELVWRVLDEAADVFDQPGCVPEERRGQPPAETFC